MNKRGLILLLTFISSILIIVGCSKNSSTNNNENVEKEKESYIEYVQKLKKVTESSSEIPFDIDVTYDKLNDEEVRYQVVIDNPKENIKNIKALAVHNRQTDDIFPSIGIFDDSVDLLLESESKGVILVGYIPYEGDLDDFDCKMKVLISYEIGEKKYTSYYVTKK